MVYQIVELLNVLTSGSSLRDLAMADPHEIEKRLAEHYIAYNDDMVEYIENVACDLAAESEGI
jgi:hypothetical protein